MTCDSCKHWTRGVIAYWPIPDAQANVGLCSLVVALKYWDDIDEAQQTVGDGKMGGENVYTNESFGCVNYEQKETE